MERKRVISSLIYKFAESFAIKGIGLVISIVLARLISPEDFGQIAIIMVFINLANTFINSGLNSALVQKKNIEIVDYSTVFYISTTIAIVLIAVLYFTAPIIAKFYDSNDLIIILRVYVFVLLFGAFNSVQIAKLQREMKFKLMMYCNLISTILSGAIGVMMAFYGKGIWALVLYYFSNTVISSFLMLFATRWFPKFMFSINSAKTLFSYGWKLLVSSLLCSIYNDIRSLIIGKKFSSESLGFYDRGQQFPNIVSITADNAIQSVMFPTLSSVQDEKERLKALLRRSMTTSALIILPAALGITAVAENLVLVLFGEQWAESIPFMQIISIAEAHIAITSANLITIKATGRSDIYMKLEIVRRISMIGILLISILCFNSVKAIAIGYAISAWIDVIIVTVPMKKIVGYGLLSQLKDVWKIAFAAVLMGALVMFLGKILIIPMILKLITQVIFGGIIYFLLCLVLRIESFNYILGILKKYFLRRSK